MTDSRPRHGLGFKIAVAVIPTILLLLVLEGATRLFWSQDVKPQHVGIVFSDPNRNVSYENIEYKTNSYGIRSKEIPEEKPEGTKRIMALGDSFTWGTGLPVEELVTTKIENLLRSDYEDLDVINTAYGSATTADEFKQLELLAPVYDPDFVVVFFFTNDVLPVTRNVTTGVSFRQRMKEFLRRKSRFFAYLYYQLKMNYSGPSFLLPPEYRNLDDSKPGWVAFKKALLDIHRFCRDRDMGLLFVVIPTLSSLNENYPYQELREKVKGFARANGIETLDLFDTFAPYPVESLWVSPENTHWNSKGTTLAAERVTERIRSMLE